MTSDTAFTAMGSRPSERMPDRAEVFISYSRFRWGDRPTRIPIHALLAAGGHGRSLLTSSR